MREIALGIEPSLSLLTTTIDPVDVWMMMLVVAILFVATFILMKLFPKRKYAPVYQVPQVVLPQ